MPRYRCFFFGDDLQVRRMADAIHPDDENAKRWGLGILAHQSDRATCEIWEGNRLVCLFTGLPPSI